MRLAALKTLFPTWQNALLALLSCGLLVLAFPPFELWLTAWFALVPMMWAVERENSVRRSFVLGWLFGNVFFFATCWWLAFAPITYAGFPPILAYALLFCVTSVAGIFPGIFGAIFSILLRRYGSTAFLAAPFVWVFTEFLRYWFTGNNWNAVGYSQAFNETAFSLVKTARLGGVYYVGFWLLLSSVIVTALLSSAIPEFFSRETANRTPLFRLNTFFASFFCLIFVFPVAFISGFDFYSSNSSGRPEPERFSVVAIQPNVPMSNLTLEKWRQLRQRHIQLAESALARIEINPGSAIHDPKLTVIFPESPMNFMYEDDPETQEFINEFAKSNNVSVLFNSAEPDVSNGKFFNSAVMVGPDGKEVAQYDKIYLLPFGEAVPFPLEGVLPGFVGNFSYGREYDLLPLGDAKAGVMICFESHFGQLSREYVRNGADVIIEMTNDGYLGPTPVLRQHLANAVFRAVETNRPVLRVTNVGITAYINERGQVLDPAESYVEATRVWSVARSDGSQTFYVKYGDWFAWLCSIVTLGLLIFSFRRKHDQVENSH